MEAKVRVLDQLRWITIRDFDRPQVPNSAGQTLIPASVDVAHHGRAPLLVQHKSGLACRKNLSRRLVTSF